MNQESPSSETSPYQILAAETVDRESLRGLYDSVGWSGYTRDLSVLLAAINGSDCLFIARENHTLIGLARAISDDASILYVQDILVRPTHQGKGIGRGLLKAVLARYEHVRQKVLLTDDRPEQLRFYGSLGFKNTRDLVKTPLNAFVIIEGADLA